MQITTAMFNFDALIRSHGWVFLAPFAWETGTHSLRRPLRTDDGEVVQVVIRASVSKGKCVVLIRALDDRSFHKSRKNSIAKQVRRMLRLDEDFGEFRSLCQNDPSLRFVSRTGRGPMLRGPDAFEDVIKTVCTTNCDWRNTKLMCESLCMLDGGAFPTPSEIMRHSTAQLARKTRVGYRAVTVRKIAALFAEGQLPLDLWAEKGEFRRIREELGKIWGIGPYSLNHVLVLLGCYSDIPVDSEVLRYLRDTHFGGREVSAEEAVKPYERFGKYRFLAYKFGQMARKMNYIDK